MTALAAYAASNLLISDQLRHTPLFSGLPTDRAACLAMLRKGGFFDVPSGQQIVGMGEDPALFVVTSGCVRDAISGRTWAEGAYFGVAESLADRPFAMAIATVAPTRLYRLEGPLLRDLLATCPAIADRMGAAPPAVDQRPVIDDAMSS